MIRGGRQATIAVATYPTVAMGERRRGPAGAVVLIRHRITYTEAQTVLEVWTTEPGAAERNHAPTYHPKMLAAYRRLAEIERSYQR